MQQAGFQSVRSFLQLLHLSPAHVYLTTLCGRYRKFSLS